jgi:hypothetical protein
LKDVVVQGAVEDSRSGNRKTKVSNQYGPLQGIVSGDIDSAVRESKTNRQFLLMQVFWDFFSEKFDILIRDFTIG